MQISSLPFAITLIGCLFSQNILANESVDLLKLYEKAMVYDAQLAKDQAASNAKKQLVPKSRSQLLPGVFLKADTNKQRLKILDNSSSITYNTHGYALTLSQPIFRLDRWFDLQAASALSKQAEIELAASQQSLISRVANAYFNVLRAQENLTTAKAEEDAFALSLEQIEQRFEVGLTAITDVYDARARFDSAKVLRIQAESDLSTSFAELELLSGEIYDNLSMLKDEFPLSPPNPTDIQSWIDRAMQDNLNIKIIEFSKDAAGARVKQAKSGHLPSVDAIASYSHDVNHGASFLGEKTDNYVIGLELNVPIFQGGLVTATSREAAFQFEEAKQQLLQTKREVSRDTKRLYQIVETDVYRIDAAKQALQSRQSALDASEIGYEVGSRNIVDVLQSKSEFFKAKRDYLNARFDYILDSLQLKYLVGTLSPDDLRELNQWLVSTDSAPKADVNQNKAESEN